jgi:GTP-binding protein
MFVDYVEIDVIAGTGGSGAEAWRRETFVPLGGPSGGDGGRGGNVLVVADGQLSTLLDYRYRKHYKAERGQHGQGKNRTGRDGEDLTLRVPIGTIVRDVATGETLGEMIEDGQQLIAARGGRGGRGNAAFATATNRTPRRWEPGAEGEERRIALELKLIADVGLVGQPNAGKSTFLAAVSAATPRIADYPFTTLSPNLGVVQLVADIPGIIEGAHEGKGLGLRFLRHIERTRTLAFLIPLDADDLDAEYRLLRRELAAHSEELAAKPHCIVLTKSDLLGDDAPPRVDAPDAWGQYVISAVARSGLDPLLEELWAHVQERIEDETSGFDDAEEEEPWRP